MLSYDVYHVQQYLTISISQPGTYHRYQACYLLIQSHVGRFIVLRRVALAPLPHACPGGGPCTFHYHYCGIPRAIGSTSISGTVFVYMQICTYTVYEEQTRSSIVERQRTVSKF